MAILCGARAKRDIRRSGGGLGGGGMATGGMVLGVIGLLSAVTIWIAVAVGVHLVQKSLKEPAAPTSLLMGQAARLNGLDSITGISTVTVYSYSEPAASEDPTLSQQRGKQFATAYVQVCAGSSGSQDGPNLSDFSLVFADATQVEAIPGDVRKPSIGNVHTLSAHQCVSGYVPFEIAAGTTPTSVQYQALSPRRWLITPSG